MSRRRTKLLPLPVTLADPSTMLRACPECNEGASLTVESAVEVFLKRDLSPNTFRSFRSDLGRFIRAFQGRAVAFLSPEEIRAYLDGLTTRKGQPASPETCNRHFGTLTNLFSWLLRQGEVEKNPLDRLERRRLGERLPRPMTPEQIETFFGRITDPSTSRPVAPMRSQPTSLLMTGLRDRALFSLLYRSGLRVGEALSLDVADVNLEGGTFRVVGKGNAERVGYLSEETRLYFPPKTRPRAKVEK